MNEIVITRAKRGKQVHEITERHFFADNETGEMFLRMQVDKHGASNIMRLGTDAKPLSYFMSYMEAPEFWKERRFHEFGSSNDMCKWVSNGRRLQDLQGDGKDEWIPSGSLRHGEFYEHVHGSFMEDRGKVFLLSHSNQGGYPMMCLNSGHGHNIHQYETSMFWPLGPGDSITITNKP